MVTICIAFKLPPRYDQAARTISRHVARQSPSQFVLGERFAREDGEIPVAHSTVLQVEIDPEDIPAMWDAVQQKVASHSSLRIDNAVYRHNPYGAVEAHWDASPEWTALQQDVVDAARPFCRMADKDPSGVSNEEILSFWQQNPDNQDRIAKFTQDHFAETGPWYSPHATFTWLDTEFEAHPDGLHDSDGEVTKEGFPDLEPLQAEYPAEAFNGAELGELCCFRRGGLGTCLDERADPITLPSRQEARAVRAATAGITSPGVAAGEPRPEPDSAHHSTIDPERGRSGR
ncbi:hypothetical protein PWY87_17700 [Kribbella solani]|uniref:hypothetical protein n=1 Tax=Kribbella solani TaxID=236067 RepID=UPI0029A7DD68|nr:hypothetical protein [Kribbella solani]MDX2970515.1 hypothetical protein [Kribbella solani]MDX3003525.1 hypothetical protein [Kribbella solani]